MDWKTIHSATAKLDIQYSDPKEGSQDKNIEEVCRLRASFPSPIVAYLPPLHENVKQCEIEIVTPQNKTFQDVLKEGSPIVIFLPATGDEGFSMRRSLYSTPLARDHGISSILVQLPYYGKRRLPDQATYAMDKLQYYSGQSLAAVMEGNILVRWLREEQGFHGKIAFSGLSYGGSMAALANIFCKYSVASIAFVPANSPNDAYVEGEMARTVQWHMFPNGKQDASDLFTIMDIGKTSIREKDTPILPNEPKKVYLQISAVYDRYIPLKCADFMYYGMQQLRNLAYSKLIYIPGGHATGFVFYRKFYLEKIVEGIQLLDQYGSDNCDVA